MNLWTIIPAKDFAAAKQRLGPELSAADRCRLARRLAGRTFDLVAEAGLGPVVVVTAGDEAAALARARGYVVLAEAATGHSNAVAQATRLARDDGADGVLTLATDLPLLTVADVVTLRDSAKSLTLVIAPDHHGTGTNALAVAPAEFTYHFGPDSLRLHLAEAARRGLAAQVLRTPGLAVDLDTAADLDWVGWR